MNVKKQDIAPEQDAPTPEPSAQDEFDAALAEFDDDGAPAIDVAAEPESKDEATSAEEDHAPAYNAAALQPAESGNDSPGGANSENDPWADAPANLRTLHEAERRDNDLKLRSANGRVAGLDRKVAELTRQLAELQNGRQKPDAAQQGDGNEDADDGNASGSLSDEALSQLREDYPDLAGPLIDMLEAQGKTIAQLSKGVGAFEQSQSDAYIARQEKVLTDEHSDWREVVADERFGGWVQTQPQSIQDAMKRNFDAIVDGADAALVVGRFKEAVGYQPQPQPDPKRQRQLQGHRDTGRTGPSSRTGIAKDDFDGAVNAFLADG